MLRDGQLEGCAGHSLHLREEVHQGKNLPWLKLRQVISERREPVPPRTAAAPANRRTQPPLPQCTLDLLQKLDLAIKTRFAKQWVSGGCSLSHHRHQLLL